ncbi:hypothetical protein QRX60_17340 [Amycolatopsis mongoliensis]|uniref:Uncharacterized protein n=1 Tax=Amycolatopsis mongoliensis TaxID=715475 RepID=A0A9Y2NN48_9PSEU|nr:hypothetical protein [Amycolatopsis sp. 4-36]WIY05523.1 hypothetical protein QRX60_17340 [Amycolatopsis sp. 4-36]
MKYEQNLQIKLRDRYRRLYKTGQDAYVTECRYLRSFVLNSPALRAIVESVQRFDPEFIAKDWIDQNINSDGYDWPNTEEGRAKVVWQLLNDLADGNAQINLFAFSFAPFGERDLDAALRCMTDQAIEPFVDYLQERLGTASQTLYLMERLKRRLETFDVNELYARYNTDKKHGEAIYDRYIQKFLFDQGVDYIISQPRSASGEADNIANLGSDDSLVEETKLYNGDNYDVSYIRKGFNQAVQYAHDYGKTVSYLIVINLSENNLQISSDEEATLWPPRLHASGVTVFVIAIRARPMPSASLRGSQKTVAVTRDDLVRLE